MTGQADNGVKDGASNMMSYLEAMLQQLESAQGGQDAEARALMDTLRQQLAMNAQSGGAGGQQPRGEQSQAQAPAPVSEAQVAKELVTLEKQLDAIETTLSSMPQEAKEMVGQSAALWMNSGSDEDQQ